MINDILKSESGCSIVLTLIAYSSFELKFKLLRKIAQLVLMDITKLAKATHSKLFFLKEIF